MNARHARHHHDFLAFSLALLALGAGGCSACDGTRFDVRDGSERFPVPGLGPAVTVVFTDITTSGGTPQRALDVYVYENDRELARGSNLYEDQSIAFNYQGRSYTIEVLRYIEHLLNADEAQLCLHAP